VFYVLVLAVTGWLAGHVGLVVEKSMVSPEIGSYLMDVTAQSSSAEVDDQWSLASTLL
jgi:hypothetical protein